jgi:hypothetical protein
MSLAKFCVFYAVYFGNPDILCLEGSGSFFIMRSERLAVATPEDSKQK